MAAEIVNACSGAAMMTAWAVHYRMGPLLLGALAGLPFFGQLVQIPAAWLTSRYGRKRVAILGTTAARQALLPLLALPFLPISIAAGRAALLVMVGGSAVCAVIGNNAWTAWVGDLVPARIRGRYFGRRAALCTLGGAAASLAAGALMDAARAHNKTGITLAAFSILGWVAGVATTRLMAKQHDPPDPDRAPVALRDVLSPLRHGPSRSALVYQIAWNASVGVTMSLCAIQMLETLHLGFMGMALYSAAIAGVRSVTNPLWGRAVDRVGSRPILVVCSFGSALSSALWLFATPGNIWPIAVDAILSGALLSGQELAAFATPLSVAPRGSRPLHIGAFVMAGGLAFGIASLAGGALRAGLSTIAPALDARAIFWVSSCGRLAASLLALRIAEPGASSVAELGRLFSRGAVAGGRALVISATSLVRFDLGG